MVIKLDGKFDLIPTAHNASGISKFVLKKAGNLAPHE
jgi:hypothetical protein